MPAESVPATPAQDEPLDPLPEGVTHQTFTHYVQHKDDLIGFVAYSIYKQHKISFLALEYKKTQKAVPQEKVDAFCAAYGNPDQVLLLRNQAEQLLSHLNAALVAEKESQITAKKQEELIQRLQAGPGKLQAAFHGLLGNILTGVVVGVFAFLAMTQQYGFWGSVAIVTGYEKKTPSTATSTQNSAAQSN